MKIIYIIHGTYNSAGMERILTIKANYFAEEMGYDVVIVTTDQRGRKPYYPLSDKIECVDLLINFDQYYEFNILKRIFLFLIKNLILKRKLRRLLSSHKADIVVSLMSRVILFLSKINDGSKKVFEYHFSRNVRSQMFTDSKSEWLKRIVYKSRANAEYENIKKLDAFVVLTHEDALLWGNMPNLSVIPNAISFYPESKAELNNKIVISVGRIEPQKGYDYLVDVWTPVYEKYPDWKMYVIGNGRNLEDIIKQINQANLQDVIIIKSPTPRIQEELLNSSIYLMTSRFEGFPMVLVEAMACGLPVISFRCPCGPADIITNDVDGFIVEVGDTELMTKKIILLIENVELRKYMGYNARENVKRYSKDEVMSQWITLFNKLISVK